MAEEAIGMPLDFTQRLHGVLGTGVTASDFEFQRPHFRWHGGNCLGVEHEWHNQIVMLLNKGDLSRRFLL